MEESFVITRPTGEVLRWIGEYAGRFEPQYVWSAGPPAGFKEVYAERWHAAAALREARERGRFAGAEVVTLTAWRASQPA